MAISHFLLFPALRPDDPTYWFMMQIGMMLGFLTSYPVNWWLVKSGLKEAMNSAPQHRMSPWICLWRHKGCNPSS